MKTILKVISSAAVALAMVANTQAAVIEVTMTADNIVSGGVCADLGCTTIATNWSDFGVMTNSTNWKRSDTVSFNLEPGVYSFAWLVQNQLANSSGNPAALLAEFMVDGVAFHSNAGWEIFNSTNGDLIGSATEYGANGASGVVWTSANRGAIAGISGDAKWIYSANNFAAADRSVWLRTQVEVPGVAQVEVSAPSMFGVLGAFAAFMAYRRSRFSA